MRLCCLPFPRTTVDLELHLQKWPYNNIPIDNLENFVCWVIKKLKETGREVKIRIYVLSTCDHQPATYTLHSADYLIFSNYQTTPTVILLAEPPGPRPGTGLL